jgi:molybdopterin-containing oxidoreductase family membrane subunit
MVSVLVLPNQFGSLWVIRHYFGMYLQFQLFISFSSFWWTGFLPDFAMLRDRAITPFNKRIYSISSFGWSGRAKDWQRFEFSCSSWFSYPFSTFCAYYCIYGFAATSVIPGWHTTIFPPYFCWGCFFRFCYGEYAYHEKSI